MVLIFDARSLLSAKSLANMASTLICLISPSSCRGISILPITVLTLASSPLVSIPQQLRTYHPVPHHPACTPTAPLEVYSAPWPVATTYLRLLLPLRLKGKVICSSRRSKQRPSYRPQLLKRSQIMLRPTPMSNGPLTHSIFSARRPWRLLLAGPTELSTYLSHNRNLIGRIKAWALMLTTIGCILHSRSTIGIHYDVV